MSLWRTLRGLDDRVRRRWNLRPGPDPFPCAWCAEEDRHDMCTGKAVRPHLEGAAAFAWRRVGTAVEPCSCSLRDHAASG